MTGYPNWNHEAFHEAAQYLRDHGYEVFNPAEIAGGDTSQDSTYYFRICMQTLPECDGLVKLPEWEFSRHASVEVRVAKLCGLPVWNLEEFKRSQSTSN
jgi:hypothetical protein